MTEIKHKNSEERRRQFFFEISTFGITVAATLFILLVPIIGLTLVAIVPCLLGCAGWSTHPDSVQFGHYLGWALPVISAAVAIFGACLVVGILKVRSLVVSTLLTMFMTGGAVILVFLFSMQLQNTVG
jgi:hypothetical protein